MEEIESSVPDKEIHTKRSAVVLFAVSAIFMVVTVISGLFIEREILGKVMSYLQQDQFPIGVFHPKVLGRVALFSFGLPLGLVALFGSSLMRSQERSSKIRLLMGIGLVLFSLVVLMPKIFGRETSNAYFGIGGFVILGSIIASYWFWARYRISLDPASKPAADFRALGYLCFGLAAWHICAFSAAPGFALFPEKMLELGVRPFAIGQLKAIMAYFVLGWIFTAIGFYKSATVKN